MLLPFPPFMVSNLILVNPTNPILFCPIFPGAVPSSYTARSPSFISPSLAQRVFPGPSRTQAAPSEKNHYFTLSPRLPMLPHFLALFFVPSFPNLKPASSFRLTCCCKIDPPLYHILRPLIIRPLRLSNFFQAHFHWWPPAASCIASNSRVHSHVARLL